MTRAAGVLLCVLVPAAATAQAPASGDTANGWNGTAVLQLLERARSRRLQPRGDTALRSYTAKASGHIYFYLDRPEGDETTLVKVNQIALQLYWAAPNLTKQRIVGLRDADPLPNRMHYHLDHLTVVQNGFSDIIRIGDGDEVRDVPHPAAPGSGDVYDFRLADSLTLTFPPQPPVRVYEVQVRPRRYDRSGLIGSLFIDRASGDIVRMTFTFTPASYVDRRLDYINISLDNGLWSGRYWLPNEQYVEIRRQIPELDFVAGAVIKGRLRVYDYEFNVDLPRTLFYGPPVEAASEAVRKAFPFEETIYAGLDREGLTQPPQVATLRAQALELMRQRKLSGLPSLRPHIASASSVLRYNHAEGVFAGLGAIYTPQGQTRYDATFGYAFEAARPEITLRARYETESARAISVRAYYNEPRDQGVRPALPAILNSASTALLGRDYLHLYFTRGGEARWLVPLSRTGAVGFRAAYEEHSQPEPGELTVAQLERVRATTEGTLGLAEATFEPGRWTLGSNWTARAELSAGVRRFDPAPGADSSLAEPSVYGRTRVALIAAFESPHRSTRLSLSASGGLVMGDPPFQDLFILGGLGTLPGNHYRNLIGKSYALVEAEAARVLWAPWLQVRATAAAGFTGQRDFPAGWPQGTRRSAASIGVGIGLFWDVLRFDVSRGRDFTRVYFTVRPDLWDML